MPVDETAGQVVLRPVIAIVLYRPEADQLAMTLATACESGWRVLLFANGSLGEGCDAILARADHAVVIRSDRNVGLAAGLNRLVQQAADDGADHVLLLDQDSTPSADLPTMLRSDFEALVNLGARPAAIGPRLVAPDNENFLAPRLIRRRDDTSGRFVALEYLPISGLYLSIAAFREIGAFEEDLFVDAVDIEWGIRATLGGYRCFLSERAAMPHRWGQESAARALPQIGRIPPVRIYYHLRNSVAILRRHTTPLRWRLILAGAIAKNIGLLCACPGIQNRAAKLRVALLALKDGLSGQLGAYQGT